MNAHQLVNQDSGNVEWYTPEPIVEAARRVMGSIDLDPASSEIANRTVRAGTYFTREEDGLSRPWFGRVFLNPPFSDAKKFIDKLFVEFEAKRVREACVITFASLDTAWARRLMLYPRWYPEGRLAYIPEKEAWPGYRQPALGLDGIEEDAPNEPETDAPPKASMVTFVGPLDAVDIFAAEFFKIGGTVDVPWSWHKAELRKQTREYVSGVARWR